MSEPSRHSVSVAAVVSRNLLEQREFSGRIEAIESAQIRSRVPGTIDAVRARFGADAVGRAVHATDGRVRTDRRGSLWGPDDEPADAPDPPARSSAAGE